MAVGSGSEVVVTLAILGNQAVAKLFGELTVPTPNSGLFLGLRVTIRNVPVLNGNVQCLPGGLTITKV